mmetsp:Transcript_18557/g.60756  ORF Transcript_18557/g.60756 Transcript_18557/m.60756 type:complete len:209 (+) Transcript_18557:582-1208(+)
MSPSRVTHLRRRRSHTARADSRSSHTKAAPKTCWMAGRSSASASTSETAGTARLPTSDETCLSCAGVGSAALILLSGMSVTLRVSPPFVSSSMPVFSSSTTTCCNFPPASASSAVASAGRGTRISDATVPLTLLRSNLGSGSRYRNSAAPPSAAAAASAAEDRAAARWVAAAWLAAAAGSADGSRRSAASAAAAAAAAASRRARSARA